MGYGRGKLLVPDGRPVALGALNPLRSSRLFGLRLADGLLDGISKARENFLIQRACGEVPGRASIGFSLRVEPFRTAAEVTQRSFGARSASANTDWPEMLKNDQVKACTAIMRRNGAERKSVNLKGGRQCVAGGAEIEG
jgi:hypothetical protein